MERRLAAILAADVVGYRRLMGQDEVGTLEALKTLRLQVIDPKIAKHKGRIFKSTGDGWLAEFPSVVNAVACAVDIQRAMEARNSDVVEERAIRLRIGVNLGDVIIEGDDIFGDGVNVAARLEGMAPPGGVAISGTVRDHLGNRLDLQFDDMGEQALKNIDKPVRVLRASIGAQVSLVSAVSLPIKPSIAVLPFQNMSSDPEQELFADGLTEDLITALSKVPGLLVIARHSTFAYKGKSVDVRRAAKELGVGHIVEGSVRRAANRVRVTAQLIEAVAGGHVWADKFDRNLDDIFAVQDEVVGHVVNALSVALPVSPLTSKRSVPKIEAYELFLRGRVLTEQTETTEFGRPFLEKAIELDPHFAEAHAWLAMNLTFQWINWGQIDERATILAEAERAVSLDPGNADAHFVRAYANTYNGDLSAGRTQFQLALESNPNHADA